jgi:beta-lactamase superfamily II metal-dependent hydrolase
MRIVKSFAADFRLLLPAAVLLLSSGVGAASPQVTPSERVVNAVNVRERPTVASPILGELRAGERAELGVSVPRWHRVRLADGVEGFVSKTWTDVVEVPAGPLHFRIHFLDVGTGDAAVIDIGETEIIIDGGDSPRVLYDYA